MKTHRKKLPVVDRGDDAAIQSLKGHPGIEALLNRFKLQQAILVQKLCTTEFKNLDDVNRIQHFLLGVRYAQHEIANATKNLEIKKQRPASAYEVEQFEKIRASIESVRPTDL